eukprot:XP_001700178.1 predicted protein [Chlamydomonas reinhardtii]
MRVGCVVLWWIPAQEALFWAGTIVALMFNFYASAIRASRELLNTLRGLRGQGL